MAQSSIIHITGPQWFRFLVSAIMLSHILTGSPIVAAEAEQDRSDVQTMLQMTPDEAESRTLVIFHMMDINKDGKVDKAEAVAWVSEIKSWDQKKQVNEELKTLDTDGNGFITLDEMKVAFGPADGDSEAEKDVETRFLIADLDGDGQLSFAELTQLFDPSKNEKLLNFEIQAVLKSQDKNGDGAIDFEEFLDSENVTDAEKEEFRMEFNMYDANGDNLVTSDEIKKVIMESSADSETKIQHFFTDENTAITEDDIKARLLEFAVSPFTEEGELIRYPDDFPHLKLPYHSIEAPESNDTADFGKDEL